MFGSSDDDGCTASTGPMGERDCHSWPGCGCGSDEQRTRREDEANVRGPDGYFEPVSVRIDRIPLGGRTQETQQDRSLAALERKLRDARVETHRLKRKLNLLRNFIVATVPSTFKNMKRLREMLGEDLG